MRALLVVMALSVPVAASASNCPVGVTDQLEGLYGWQLARQNTSGRGDLGLVIKRLTPALYQQLKRAWDLDPRVDGAYLDFDVFSGTQVTTFAASVTGCRKLSGERIDADVAVRAGLRDRAAEAPVLLTYQMQRMGDAWRIADIRYGTSGHLLTNTLSQLLKAASRAPR